MADIERRGAWDDRLIDALCDPPESFVMSSVVAHVLTFSIARRQLVRQFIRAGGGEIDEGDPINWLRRQLRRGDRMTKTIFYTATTLDGYLADENDSLDWLFVQEQDENGPMNYGEFIQDIGAIAMGATTYQWILDHNARTGEKWAYEMPVLGLHPPHVRPARRRRSRSRRANVAEVHAAMVEAAGGKDLWVVGGGDLAAQFAEAKLLDELVLYIAPVTLGAGRPLFPRKFDLELTELDRNGAFVCARYAVKGPRGG